MPPEEKPSRKRNWDARRVRELRKYLGLSQDALADELGTRQQTVSEWETGQYQPRGASSTLLNIVAERAGFEYGATTAEEGRREGGRRGRRNGGYRVRNATQEYVSPPSHFPFPTSNFQPARLREPTARYRTRVPAAAPAPAPRLLEADPALAPRLLEADLFRLWEGQRFPKKALVAEDGTPLRVIFRGRPGAGPGPDFRGAIISSPRGLLQGDVELHVRTSDFLRHGHGDDPNYANIALHVVFFHDETGETPLPGGGRAPVLALGGPQAARWLERPARWGEPCRDAVARMSSESVAATLDRLGAMRFRQKAAAFGKRTRAGEAVEELLWCGLLEALAYGGERLAFRALGEALPWAELRSKMLAADLRGLDGDFSAADFRRLNADCLAILSDRFAALGIAPSRPARPGNGPEKRLAGAAALAVRFASPGLAASLIGPLAEPESAAQEIVAALTVARFVGRARAIEIAGNVVLPLAAALCDEPAASRIEGVFAELPLPAKYGAVKHLHAVTAKDVRVGMRRQQGMLYLLHQYCTAGGCGKCPLSE